MKIQYFRLFNGKETPSLEGLAPYKAIIIIEDHVDAGWQRTVSEWLVRTGCLYMMAWGIEASSWDDSVDEANIDQFKFRDIPEERFVMTTWHEDETLQEMMEYAKYTAAHTVIEIEGLLMLHIGRSDREDEFLELYLAA